MSALPSTPAPDTQAGQDGHGVTRNDERAPSPSTPQEGGDDFSPAFIHSLLDEYGLSPAQFRVYAHVTRRAGRYGKSYESIANMARICQLHPQTLRKSLQFLVSYRFLTREDRLGTTPNYRLTPPSEWKPLTGINHAPSEKDAPPSVSQVTPPKRIQAPPCETNGAEVTPVEGNPVKANPLNPPSGDSDGNKSLVSCDLVEEIFEAYPRKVGRPAALRAIKRALKSHPAEFVLQRTKRYASSYHGEPQFIPYPARWFSEARFNDDSSSWNGTAGPSCSKHPLPPPRQFDSASYQEPTDNF